MARRRAAILAADAVGYSRLLGEDEADTQTRRIGETHDSLLSPEPGDIDARYCPAP